MTANTRRVRMYIGQYDVRVTFEDATGIAHRFYTDPLEAEADYRAFIDLRLSVKDALTS